MGKEINYYVFLSESRFKKYSFVFTTLTGILASRLTFYRICKHQPAYASGSQGSPLRPHRQDQVSAVSEGFFSKILK
jgi:hypothetical protein